MQYLDLVLPTPAENLACDEALLDYCEENGGDEVLRVWESSDYFVVVGYANKVDREVNHESCRLQDIPILRRCTGGGTVVQGPGCLNYSLILNASANSSLQTITGTNRFIMGRHRELFEGKSGNKVEIQGHTDLAMEGLKFSGNAQRRKKNYLLFHGTFLLDFDLTMIQTLLRMPSKQPAYRANRPHNEFLLNLHWSAPRVKNLLREAWKADQSQVTNSPIAGNLIAKYRSEEWNLKF